MGDHQKYLVALLAATLIGAGGSSFAEVAAPGHDPELFLADLAQLERFTASTYAHFEWAITEGGIDPVVLHQQTHDAIAASKNRDQALAALHGFVKSFDDGHFRLRAPEPTAETGSDARETRGPHPEDAGVEACAALGFKDHDKAFRIDFGERFQMITAEDDPFPAGWLDLGDERRVGILRIDEFGAERYSEYCNATWETYRQQLDGPCVDARCRRVFRFAVEDRLLTEISKRVERLREAGMEALVVDITTNGGGSDWYDPAARLLTDRPLRGSAVSFVRHRHWRGILEEMRDEVVADLGRSDLDRGQREMLEAIRTRLDVGIAATRQECNLSSIWKQAVAELPCTPLVRDISFTTGLLRREPSVDVAGFETRTSLFKPLLHDPHPSVWSGPLAVMINHDTASASVAFSALLRDNDAAIIIGERASWGAGCGYTNGGIQEQLIHSGLEVWASDCVRHRRDGSSERAGIQPDISVPWEFGDSKQDLGHKFIARLKDWHFEVSPAR